MFDAPRDLDLVEIPLTVEHCHSLGVRSATGAARRRTFNEAGARVCTRSGSGTWPRRDAGATLRDGHL
jgi:hypothetical protein